jgi:hypothetical protein
MTIRIAMWSGPRNISTALMRSFENRPDTRVVDEPFYAYYLSRSGVRHPGKEEVIASQSTSWQSVARQLCEDPVDQDVFYQKHMTHHILDDVALDWTPKLTHCFLIRDPLYVVNSYSKKRETVNSKDIGILRQLELYEQISDITGQDIPILDSKEILLNPSRALEMLCQYLGISFREEMLSWPAGTRSSDGVWARHWYHEVEKSTGFSPFTEPVIEISDQLQQIADASRPAYQALHERRLRILD